jgi:membrane protein
MIRIFKDVFNHFLDSDTFQKGAALAYYAVFSIFPIIIIITSLLGFFFGDEAVSGEIHHELKDILGDQTAMQLQEMIKNQYINHNSLLTTIIGFITLGLAASGMLSQIHNAFNKIWHIKEKPKNGLVKYAIKQLSSLMVLIMLFFIVLVSTSINSLLIQYSENFISNSTIISIYTYLASFVLMVIIIALMFKLLGDAKVHWKPALIGGAFTALLFLIGKIGISMYIGHSHVTTTFGAASAVVLLMLWVYYISQIIFLGASFVQIVSDRLHLKITAKSQAVIIGHQEITE